MPTYLQAKGNGDALLRYSAVINGEERRFVERKALFEGQYYALPDEIEGHEVTGISYTGEVKEGAKPPHEKTAEGEAEAATAAAKAKK